MQGRYTRGMTLLSLGKYQEALLELSLSAVLGENVQKVKSQINEVLQRLLVMYSKGAEASGLGAWNPISHGDTKIPKMRYLRSYLNTFIGRPDGFENVDEDTCNDLILQVNGRHRTQN